MSGRGQSKLQVSKHSPQYMIKEDLSYLVQKHIKHKLIEDGQLVAYSGRVISQIPRLRYWFNVVYTCELHVVYAFNICEDLKNGDLSVS